MVDHFGLDIGSYSLKVVELEKTNDRFRLLNFGFLPTPSGVLLSEAELDQKKLSDSIRQLTREAHVRSRYAVVAFPESQIFSRVIEFPQMSETQLNKAIKYEAEQYIPMPIDEVNLSWQLLKEKDGAVSEKMRVFLVAAPKTLISRYIKILREAEVEPLVFETEILALKRSVLDIGQSPTTLLVSIGASTTDLCISDSGLIRFSRSIGTGGVALARSISQELGFEMSQAEEYKKSYGLLPDQLEGKIMQIIRPVFDVIVNEIEKAMLFYQTKNPLNPVKRVVLVGGSALLPGVVVYLAENLGLEVQIGDPWVRVDASGDLKKELTHPENQAKYALAVGLAQRDV